MPNEEMINYLADLCTDGPEELLIPCILKQITLERVQALITSTLRLLGKHFQPHLDGTSSLEWYETESITKTLNWINRIRDFELDLPVEAFYLKDKDIADYLTSRLVMSGNHAKNYLPLVVPVLDLQAKAVLIELENVLQMRHEHQDAFFRTLFEGVQSTALNLTVRRDNLVRDTLSQLEGKRPYELRRELKVKFEGEDGVDEGGLKKEFFQLLLKSCFDPAYGLFKYFEESRLYWFCSANDDKSASEIAEDCYAIGKLFGLAAYNSVLLEARFPLALYRILLHAPIGLKDLQELDPSLGRSLEALLNMSEEDFRASGLEGSPFEIEVATPHSIKPLRFQLPTTETELTFENRDIFVQLYTDAILHRTVELNIQAFIKGFKFVSGKSVLFRFAPEEIACLISGSEVLDFEALKATTIYDGGFTAKSQIIRWFWDILLKECTDEQRHNFLVFVTGSDRAPIGGLGEIHMRIVKNGPDADRLPTAHTCFNTLLLNSYSSKRKLAKWLLMAVENCSGFGLQ